MRNFSIFSYRRSRLRSVGCSFRVGCNARCKGARRRGSAIIETGLVIVALIFLSMGLLQYGLIYNATLALNNLAREGARYAAVHTETPLNANENYQEFKSVIVEHIKSKARGTSINEADITSETVSVSSLSSDGKFLAGGGVQVKITYDLKKNKIFMPVSFPGMSQKWRDGLVNYTTSALQNIEG